MKTEAKGEGGSAAPPEMGGRDLFNGFAALEPQLHGRAFEGFVVSFVFAWGEVFVVHGVLC